MIDRKTFALESGGFDPLRLHRISDNSWAVVSRQTGAIALDADNRLIMRLTETDARRLAAEMSEAQPVSRNGPTRR